MDKHKLSLLGAGLAAVVLIVGGWFIGVEPQLSSASAADVQRTSIDSTNANNRVVLQQLEAEYRELGTSKQALTALRQSVPATPDTAGFTREVQAAVTGTGVMMTSLTFGTVQAYARVGEAASGTGSTATPAPSSNATPAPAATPTPAAPATPAAPQPYRNDQITAATFDLVPVTVAVDATSYQQALDFTKRMQHSKRLFLVDTLSQTAKDGGGSAQSWSLSGYVYVVHAAATASATSSPSAPANG